MTARHRVRQARRDLIKAGLPDVARGLVRDFHGRWPVALPFHMTRDTCDRVMTVLAARWPDWVIAGPVDDVWWEYYSVPPTACPKPAPIYTTTERVPA